MSCDRDDQFEYLPLLDGRDLITQSVQEAAAEALRKLEWFKSGNGVFLPLPTAGVSDIQNLSKSGI